MQEPISFEEIDASLTSTMEETEGMPVPEETPFRVALLGDFSGRRNRGVFQTGSTLAKRRFIFVDRDNIDEAMEKLGVGINLPIFGKNAPPVHVTFSKMDDFHPDSLFNGLDVFQALRDTRRGLKDPATFA
ncbi:MAG: type VI secretion system contractile sheath small subunit, partial [Nitrospirae bacterium]|nr:type VI secretion system contractile sheath small subunit [Nitrospirota bacterium]